MHETIPWNYVAYVRAAIAGITLSEARLYLEETPDGFALVKENGFVPVCFAFPDDWKPPLHTSSRAAWLRAFFRGCALDGHWLAVTEDADGLFLDEVLEPSGGVYPWVVRFAEGWIPPHGLESECSQPRLPSECEKGELIEQLVQLYAMDPADLVVLTHEQLVPRVDLAPDMPEIGVYQRRMTRAPAHWWQRLAWPLFGTPLGWRFEIRVKASPPWQYAVVDTLEEARWVARKAHWKFSQPSPMLVGRSSVAQIATEMHRFLEHCYFTVTTIPFICTPSLPYEHAGSNRHCRLVKPWQGGLPVSYTLYETSDWGWDWAGSLSLCLGSLQFTFPVIGMIGSLDRTTFPHTAVTFEPSRLIVHMRQAHDVASAHDQTVVFMRESAIDLPVGKRDEHGIYRGE